ncbi:Unknown protein, partial [Striga hermonthica]
NYMKVSEIQYLTYRDACFEHGLLDDDREYIDGITEACHWASADSLRRMFASLLVSGSISRLTMIGNVVGNYYLMTFCTGRDD